jgi:hypothetical protein
VRVKCQKGPPAKKNCQKGPRLGGGTSVQATRVMCRLGQIRHVRAATPNAGRSPDGRRRRSLLPLVGLAAWANAGMLAWHMPARPTPTCRLWLRRQGPLEITAGTATAASQHAGFCYGGKGLPDLAQAARDMCRLARRAATETWSFLTIFFASGLF